MTEPAAKGSTVGPRPTPRWVILGLLLVLGAGFLLRCHGIHWPQRLHPDENTIARWIAYRAEHGHLHRVYPDGFFTLTRPLRRAVMEITRAGDRWDYWCGRTRTLETTEHNDVLFARWFNVAAGTLTLLWAYLFVARVARSPAAGLLGAALLALSQYHVEHSHYAETDIAMCCMLFLSCWAWAVEADRGTRGVFAAAALVSGFTAGTKYTLVLLLPVVLLRGWLRGNRGWSARAVAARCGDAVGGLLLFVIGFVWSNPGAPDVAWFMQGMHEEGRRVYGETAGLMAASGVSQHTVLVSHWRYLRIMFATLGHGWQVLALAGLPLLLTGARRRFWPVAVLFPALFLYFFLCRAPWVRSQEFLNFMPVLTVSACLAVLALVRLGSGRWRWLGPVCAGALAAAALLQTGQRAGAVASLFGWEDTRHIVHRWMRHHAPRDRNLAIEHYCAPIAARTFRNAADIYKVEYTGYSNAVEKGCSYLVRNPNCTGRGVFNELTGERHPHYQDLFNEFRAQSMPLRRWQPLSPPADATFAGPTIELWALRRAAGPELSCATPRPGWISNDGRETFVPGRGLGFDQAVEISSDPREIAVCGPDAGPVFMVLTTTERAGVAVLEGFGGRTQVTLGPWDVRVVRMERPWWRPRFSRYERVTAHTRRERHLKTLPCFLRVAFSAEDVARICLQNRRAGRFAEPMTAADWRTLAPVTATRVAREAGVSLPFAVAGTAVTRLEAVQQWLRAPGPEATLDGLPLTVVADFARARVQPDEAFTVVDFEDVFDEETGRRIAYGGAFDIPCLLADGQYTVRFETRTRAAGAGVIQVLCPELGVASEIRYEPGESEWQRQTLVIPARRETVPRLTLWSAKRVEFEFRKIEVTCTVTGLLQGAATRFLAPLPLRPEPGPVFGDCLRLVRADPDPDTGRIALTFVPITDSLPPLAVAVIHKRKGRLRSREPIPLCRGAVAPGAAFTVTIDPGDTPAAETGLCVQSDVAWFGGRLDIRGRKEDWISFAELAGALPSPAPAAP